MFAHLFRPALLSLACLSVLPFTGCQTAYYAAMEQIGLEKRDLLKHAVKSARREQEDTVETFQDALTQLKAMTGYDGGELERGYNRFKAEYDDCESQARQVRSRIAEVDRVARDLFREWEGEIAEYTDPGLAASSRSQLAQTRSRFSQLSASLHAAEATIEPVLSRFRDQVLYLKHNLNAAAIGSLRGQASSIQSDLSRLIHRMESAIQESDRIVKTL
ncbi:MAG: DUF2959 domain-containing protein [Verrucomicrobiales bacterium]|nr:DUF2959 domain-containing protein [Verrucomicrobiales bacterium]